MYPNPDIDPNSKDRRWLLEYAKQAWKDCTGRTPEMFYGAAGKYNTFKKYATGKQEITRYKKPYVNEQGETFAIDLDYTVRPIISKFRDIAISKLQQREYEIIATPIDALAKDETDKYFADIKVKILMRDALKQVNPELLDNPTIKQQQGEPGDMEELDMQKEYTWKHNMAMEGEMVWNLVADLNDFPEERNQAITYWYDLGVAGYKEWNDESNNTKLRSINPQNIISSYCRRSDFKDATHIGEVIEVNLTDLAKLFSAQDLEIIQQANSGQYAYQPTANIENKDRSKVHVLDLELISIDEMVFSQRVNSKGNLVFGSDKYDFKKRDTKVIINGKEVPKYSTRKFENVYKIKWIIGTDLCYDYGIATNQKRDKTTPAKTCLSYHIYAYNFYNMNAVGIMERLVPTLDEYQETVIKIRHFKNKWIPYIIDIDMDALEGVALGKQGDNMTPMQLLDMMFQTNVMLSRKKEAGGNNINYKSVDVQPTPMAQEFSVLIADLQRLLQEVSDLSGFNQLTDGSTPNAKTLVPIANMANDATNNSQYPIIRADKNVNERLAKGVIQRVQLAIKSGKDVQGVIRSLGSNTVKMIKISPDLPLYEFGIGIEDRPTAQYKAMLIQDLNLKNAQGQIDPDVYVMVKNCRNLKQAEMLLAYKIKKKREQDQQIALQNTQATVQGQIQSAQASEKAKQETILVESKAKINEINAKGEWDFKIANLKVDKIASATEDAASIKLAGTMMQHSHEERQNKIEQGIPVPDQTAEQITPEQPQEDSPDEENAPSEKVGSTMI